MNFLGSRRGAKAKKPDDTIALVKRVVADQGSKHWRAYARAYCFMAIAAACTAASAFIVGHTVNIIFNASNFWTVIATCLTIVVIFVVRGAVSYGQAVTLSTINNAIASEYKIRLFEKMLRENLNYFSDKHSAEINGTINYASGSIGGTLSTLITATGRDAVTLLGLIGVMVFQAPLPFLACSIIMPVAAVSMRRLRDYVQHLTEAQFLQSNALNEVTQETLHGLRVVKAFGLEDDVMRRYRRRVEAMRANAIKTMRASNRSGPLMETLGGVAIASLMMYGSYRVLEVGGEPGEIFSFITAFLLAYEPTKRLARFKIDMASNLVGLRLLFGLLDTPESEPDEDNLPGLEIAMGNIEFRDVVFSYRSNEVVMQHMSLSAEGGKITALVGPSGSGKSTVFNLLLRFYQPVSGTILIDGQDIQQVSRKSVRRAMTYVGQDTFLFRGTIMENIMVGKPDATESEIHAAAQEAFAHDFICRFPKGYDTPVGEHGVRLSTGERQRIAIARALIRNAPIILLDESTAALDSESEHAVRNAISRVCRGRTTLVIAHRLHTVLDANSINFVENGAIVESGTYNELLGYNGRFATLSKLQFDGQAA
jgi:ABC-type multidrug transport system fused ATPase/permease subunit